MLINFFPYHSFQFLSIYYHAMQARRKASSSSILARDQKEFKQYMNLSRLNPNLPWIALGLFFVGALMWRLVIPYSSNSILPQVWILSVEVGGLTKSEALAKIQSFETLGLPAELIVSSNTTYSAISREQLSLDRDLEGAINQAYAIGRSGSLITRLQDFYRSLLEKHTIVPTLSYNQDVLTAWLEAIEVTINGPLELPSASLGKTNTLTSLSIDPGDKGDVLSYPELLETITSSIASLETNTTELVSLPFTPPLLELTPLNDQEIEEARARAQRLVGMQLKLTNEQELLGEINDQAIISALLLPEGYKQDVLQTLGSAIAETTQREAVEPVLVIEDGQVVEFVPPIDGRVASALTIAEHIEKALASLENSLLESRPEGNTITLEIPLDRTPPLTQLGELNSLGINERIGVGESYFKGSIPNRVHNVKLTADRLHLTLVPPGEEFSFNKVVGEVSERTGYKPAYVISGGRTVLGDGGGVCQASTTVFRAALNTGLPITQRRGHSYRVGYYEQQSEPGLDATVYSPFVDFRFRNDTPGHILITTATDTTINRLVMEFWGTDDGRVSTVGPFKLWGQTPARATVYQDDPTLPAGVLKQVDWSAPGAKTSFAYVVTRNGETLQDTTFTTSYQPWAAVYLRGVGN